MNGMIMMRISEWIGEKISERIDGGINEKILINCEFHVVTALHKLIFERRQKNGSLN